MARTCMTSMFSAVGGGLVGCMRFSLAGSAIESVTGAPVAEAEDVTDLVGQGVRVREDTRVARGRRAVDVSRRHDDTPQQIHVAGRGAGPLPVYVGDDDH